MKKKLKLILLIFFVWSTNVHLLIAKDASSSKNETNNSSKKRNAHTIRFHYENEDLIDIINFMASQKGINIILPQGANAITNKVTMDIEELLNVDEAWNVLNTMLDIAGYALMPKGDMYSIVKVSPNITKETLPLFVGMIPEKLPNTDQRIRYIYYFTNIKVSDAEDSELITILKNLLPQATSSYKVDTNTNSVIITAKADDIRAVMKIVLELDKIDFHETLEVIKLRFTTAKFISDLFNENILKAATDFNRYRLDARQQTEATFFSKYVRLFPEERTNTIIVLGRPQAIARIKEFIFKYLDVELDSAQSILHVYQLQYSDAEKMEAVLTRIITSAQQGGSDQARISGGTTIGGVQKTFDEVIIKADKPQSADRQFYGGNKLVVAARNDDWKVIEKLIQELDTPQPQVLLEVLVADLTLEDTRILGSLLRNPAKIPLMGQTNLQADNIGTIIPNVDPNGNATTLQSDILRLAFNPNGTPGNTASIAQVIGNQTPGSTFISISDNDGSTWNLLQILQAFNNSKILSHPHVISTNNQQAYLEIGEMRLLRDEAVGSGGTTTTVKFKQEYAYIKIKITPRINAANTVQLDVKVEVNDWVSPTDNSRINRTVNTIAVVPDKDILALGGLIRVATSDTLNETPILSKIPIIGYFFKNRSNDVAKTNLTVFISPTIIEPRLRSGVDEYTKQYINLSKSYAREGVLFDSLRDPITRWFFRTGADTDDELDDFVAKDEFKAVKKREEITIDAQQTKVVKKSKRKRRRRTNQKDSLCPSPCDTYPKTTSEKAEELQKKVENDTTSPLDIAAAPSPANDLAKKDIAEKTPDKVMEQSKTEKIISESKLDTETKQHDIKSSEMSKKEVQKIKEARPVLGMEPVTTSEKPSKETAQSEKSSDTKAQELQKMIEKDTASPLKESKTPNEQSPPTPSTESSAPQASATPVVHAKILEERMHELHKLIKNDSRTHL